MVQSDNVQEKTIYNFEPSKKDSHC